MNRYMLTIGAVLIGSTVIAQTMATGYVFEDKNRNGKKDLQEVGLKDIAMTNGKDVVLTDGEGFYQLPVGKDDIISVIKPSGYQIKKDEGNLPQFFYIHKPEGSPNLKFDGVKPTGKLPKSLDFGLLPSMENEEFTALIFGDPQPYSLQELDYFAQGIVSEIEGKNDISFGLSLGDIVGNNLNLFDPYKKVIGRLEIPWYNVFGNHDRNFDAKTDEMADETFEAHFGPTNYAFNYGNVHFIVLDNVIFPDPRDGKRYWGGLREDQLEFIKNDLQYVSSEKLIVLAFHIPLNESHGDSFRDEDREKLFELLKDYPHTLSLCAHTHTQRQDFFYKKDGWLQDKPHHQYVVGTTSGDWYSGKLDDKGVPLSTMSDGTPKGYAFINFNDNKYTIDYKVAGKSKDYRMKIFSPKVVAKGKKTKAGIYANYFLGSNKDTVMYRINDREWKQMDYVVDYDPSFTASVLCEWDLSEDLMKGKRPSDPTKSTHLWRGTIPANLEEGEHKIEIKVEDMFGRTFYEYSTLRVEDPKE